MLETLGWVQALSFSACVITLIISTSILVENKMRNAQELAKLELEQKHEIDKQINK